MDCIHQLIQPTTDGLVREAYDALVVGVSSNLSFDDELKGSAARRYGELLPRMTNRLQDVNIAKSTDTSSLIFLLGVEEAMVWKVSGAPHVLFHWQLNGTGALHRSFSDEKQSFKSSQTHIEGWGRLIQMRGPESFTTPADLFTLRMFRMNAVSPCTCISIGFDSDGDTGCASPPRPKTMLPCRRRMAHDTMDLSAQKSLRPRHGSSRPNSRPRRFSRPVSKRRAQTGSNGRPSPLIHQTTPQLESRHPLQRH